MKKLLIGSMVLVNLLALTACGSSSYSDNSGGDVVEIVTESVTETKSETEAESKASAENLTAVQTICENLDASIQSIKESDYKNLDLSDAVIHFPDITELYTIRLYNDSDTSFEKIVDNAKLMVETYFPEHQYSEDNLYYWGTIEGTVGDEDLTGWPSLMANKEAIINSGITGGILYEADGTGLDAYLMMLPYTMSGTYIKGVGKMITDDDREYMAGWFPTFYYDYVDRYRVDNVPEASYQLYDRVVSLKEALEYAKDFFENKYIPAEITPQIKTEVEAIEVRQFEDIYGYRLLLKNSVDGIAFDYTFDLGTVSEMSDGTEYTEHMNEAFMAVSDDIDFWYMLQGYTRAEREGSAITEIISLEDAAEIFSKRLTGSVKFKVESIELVYCPVREETENGEVNASANAAWKMTAVNPNDGKYYIVYADAVSGEIRYFTRVLDAR